MPHQVVAFWESVGATLLRVLEGPLFTSANIFIAVGILWFFGSFRYFWWRAFSRQGIPRSLPWVGGPGGGLIFRAKVSFRSLLGLRQMLLDGYREHSKNDKSFVLPNFVNGHEVIIPTAHMPWLLEQPESVLSQFETNRQFMAGDYTMLDLLNHSWYRIDERAKRELTHGIDDFTDAMLDEVDDALRSLWGSDTEHWHEMVLYDIMLEVVGRIVARVLVGLPLCRHPGYIQASTSFSKYILLPAMAIELLPSFLKPLVGPVLTSWDKLQYHRMASYTRPLFRERIMTHRDEEKSTATTEPNDYIQWTLRDAIKHGDTPYDAEHLGAKRLAIITFTAVQSSAITITNAIIDIAACTDSVAVQQELRSEVATANNVWTRASLARLPKLDSVLTETLRLWGILTHGVTKAVVARGGVTIPTGEHVPYGAKVGIASYGPHLDGDVYGTSEANPFVYDPFRFTRPEVSAVLKKKGAKPGLGFVTTSEHYMGFSHGRFACPGRFFANSLLKILLARVVMNYDVEPIDERPTNPWLNNTIGPPVGAKIRVRRRKC
ncbi:hypothetical protein OQA88_2555 [Cercophora sp. LCS_1]